MYHLRSFSKSDHLSADFATENLILTLNPLVDISGLGFRAPPREKCDLSEMYVGFSYLIAVCSRKVKLSHCLAVCTHKIALYGLLDDVVRSSPRDFGNQ